MSNIQNQLYLENLAEIAEELSGKSALDKAEENLKRAKEILDNLFKAQ